MKACPDRHVVGVGGTGVWGALIGVCAAILDNVWENGDDMVVEPSDVRGC